MAYGAINAVQRAWACVLRSFADPTASSTRGWAKVTQRSALSNPLENLIKKVESCVH
jgi:hypothetical protein